jgi:hypothetical protein
LRGVAGVVKFSIPALALLLSTFFILPSIYVMTLMTLCSDALITLSKALDVSIPYLMETQGISLTAVDFRKTANTTAKDRARVETSLLEWVERYLQIEQLLDLDSAEWEKPINPPHPANNIEEAEHLGTCQKIEYRRF